jgi:phosphotransferase system HPr (HPr) family protein
MPKVTLTVNHEAGLHARPLAQFVKKVREFDAEVKVKNITKDKGPVNGASPLELLLLATLNGHQIEIETSGNQADEVLVALEELVNSNFGEAE